MRQVERLKKKIMVIRALKNRGETIMGQVRQASAILGLSCFRIRLLESHSLRVKELSSGSTAPVK